VKGTEHNNVGLLSPQAHIVGGSWTLVSLSLRLKDLLGPVTRVKKKKTKVMAAEQQLDSGARALSGMGREFNLPWRKAGLLTSSQ